MKYKIILFSILIFCFQTGFGQTYQNFDASTSLPSGWSYIDPDGSARYSVSNDNASTSYGVIAASGNNNLTMLGCSPKDTYVTVITNPVNMTGVSNIYVGFGSYVTNSFDPYTLDFSIDGTTWTNIPSLDSDATWTFRNYQLPSSADNQASLSFRIQYFNTQNSNCNSSSHKLHIDDFFVGTAASTNPLPVKLLNFTAEASRDSKGLLKWSTTEEIGFSHFEVERSGDAKGFETLGKINAKGNNESFSNYSFLDYKPLGGINYYRLKQVDIDKTSKYSKIVSLNLAFEPKLLAFPNPTSDKLIFENIKFEEIKAVKIYNMQGVLLAERQLQKLELNVSDIAAQQLLVEIELTDNTFIKRKIVKQ